MSSRERFEEFLDEHGLEQLTALLGEQLTDARRDRIEEVLRARVKSVHLASESPSDLYNALAMIRTAEAMGVSHMHLVNVEGKARVGKRTTAGAARWAELAYHRSLSDFLPAIREQGLLLVGATVDGELLLEQMPCDKPICVVFGNEQRGLSKEMAAACDFCYRIPMYGMTESYNLSVSAALTLQDILRRKRELLGQDGDLSEEELAMERAWYYYRNLPQKLSEAIT